LDDAENIIRDMFAAAQRAGALTPATRGASPPCLSWAKTAGIDLLEHLKDGRIEVASSEFLTKTREEVSAASEELFEVGARIRPLLIGKERVGCIRGVHLTERKALKRWITNVIEFVEHLLRLGTTLTVDDIRDLSLIELRSLSRVVKAISESDLKLLHVPQRLRDHQP
jgi:hypothetical protein